MYIKQRYGYLFALLFLTSSVALGSWVGAKFSFPSQQDNQILTTHIGATTCPCPTPNPSIPVGAAACPCPTPTPTPISLPNLDMNSGARLLIPTIGVDAPIEPVGVLSNGALNVPQKNPWTGVGWYKNGPVPGQSGSAIIDGHLDRPRGVPAVFWNLNQLHTGDIVTSCGCPATGTAFPRSTVAGLSA